MPSLLLFLLTVTASPEPSVALVGDPAVVEEQALSEQVSDTTDAVESLKKDMLGLEYYLKDKKEHKEFCLEIEWNQPSLEEYKKDPKSYLPEACKEKE